jgi:arylsulfatase A-like enzyme
VRQIIGPVVRYLLRPSSVGAVYVTLLAWIASLGPSQEPRLDREGSRTLLAIGAAAVFLGMLFGVAASLVVKLRDRVSRAPARSPARTVWGVLGVTAALHAFWVARSIAKTPQLYSDTWYARGGLRRTAQVLVTDVLGPRGVTVIGVALLVLYLAGPPTRWRMWPMRFRRALLPATSVLLAVGLLLTICTLRPIGAAHAASPPEHPNVLVLAADSLRADRIAPDGSSGAPRGTAIAPHLAALASKGMRFERAYTSLAEGLPSWVTLLTGREPHHHGIRSSFPRWEERARDFDALPSRLAHAGYRTEVVSDADEFARIDLGFDKRQVPTFEARHGGRLRALARQTPLLPFLHSELGRAAFPVVREMSDAADPDIVADLAIAALRRSPGRPFFVTVAFRAPQSPYAAPYPYYGMFTRAGYRGRFKYEKRGPAEGEPPPDDEDIDQIRGLYDGAVASVDAACGKILSAMERDGLLDRTIIVMTSDHGETLYEGGRGQGHGEHLFGDEGTHVPLAIVDPRKKPGSVRSIVRDVDLAPTLYELTGVVAPGDLDGRSLVAAMDGKDVPPRLAFAETGVWRTVEAPAPLPALRLPYPDLDQITVVDSAHDGERVLLRRLRPLTIVAKHRMARDERYKLVYAPTRMGAKYMLFDTEADPQEVSDVAAEHPAELIRLKVELAAWMGNDPDLHVVGDLLVPRSLTLLTPSPESP